MQRRRVLHAASLAGVTLAGGCLTITREPGTRGDACQVPQDKSLVSMLPPSPQGRTRRVDDDASEAYLEEYHATAAVSAEYVDGDDDVLDDTTVWIFRFDPDADGEQVVSDFLTNIEFDSGRRGIGMVDGRIGYLAAAPQRERAESILGTSNVVSDTCIDLNRILPPETRDADGTTSRETVTGG